jgi:hypothetical protein
MQYGEQQKETQRQYFEHAPLFFCELTFGEEVQSTAFAVPVQRRRASSSSSSAQDQGPRRHGRGRLLGHGAHNRRSSSSPGHGAWKDEDAEQDGGVSFPASLEWDLNAPPLLRALLFDVVGLGHELGT